MTERYWRLVLGILILLMLTFELDKGVLAIIAWIYFEAITNIRLAKLISKLRYGDDYISKMEKGLTTIKSDRVIPFEAERMMRISMATILLFSTQFAFLWFVPWLVGLMLASAGLTNNCPMLVFLYRLGFKSHYH